MTFDTALISAKSDNAPSGYSEGQVSYVLQFSRELLSQDDSKSTVGLHSQSDPRLATFLGMRRITCRVT
jgi:hypothetical protein